MPNGHSMQIAAFNAQNDVRHDAKRLQEHIGEESGTRKYPAALTAEHAMQVHTCPKARPL